MINQASKHRALSRNLFSSDSRALFSILFEVLSLSSRLGLSPGEYFSYGFHRKNRSNIHNYLSAHQHFTAHLSALNNRQNPVLVDKLLFKKLMAEHAIETSSIIAYTGPGKREDIDFPYVHGDNLLELLQHIDARSFIVKPSTGTQGHGIYLASFSPSMPRPYVVNNKRFTEQEFLAFMKQSSVGNDTDYLMFEKHISCPPVLQAISPTAAPNIRIITLKTPDGGVHITGASVRLGRQGSVTSNAGSGGLLACIDQETGVISHCRTSIYISGRSVKEHPDTHQPIVGFQMPQWRAVIDLCTRAAKLLENINSVGWDVLITDHGPVLLEGNDDWDVISKQVFGHGYLSERNRALLAEYGLDFGGLTLPKPALKTFRNAMLGIK